MVWRHLTDEEWAFSHFEGHQRVYLFRVPGVMDDLREEDVVEFPVRVHGGFLDAYLTFERVERYEIEGDQPRTVTTRWFEPSEPWNTARLSDMSSLRMEGSEGHWRYFVDSVRDDWPLDDVRPGDLVTRVWSPCAEYSSGGHNGTAACIRHEEVEGY